MKRNYGVQPMMQLLSGNRRYTEVHNALYDAADELELMRLLGKNDRRVYCCGNLIDIKSWYLKPLPQIIF